MKSLHNEEDIFNEIIALGVSDLSPIYTAQLSFNREYRKFCAQNLCGNFNKSWTCPPNGESIESIVEEILGYDKAVIFMVTGSIKCSVDWKSMMKVAKVLNKVCFYIMDTIVPRIGNGTVFGYGPCKYCEKCAFVTNEQCRFPDKRVRSLEGACIDVSEIAKLSGMQLKDEPDKMSFFGLFVYNL